MNNGNTPAMPIFNIEGICHNDEDGHTAGLTKREAFAMYAMQGLCANPEFTNNSYVTLSKTAVFQADALLAELEKPK